MIMHGNNGVRHLLLGLVVAVCQGRSFELAAVESQGHQLEPAAVTILLTTPTPQGRTRRRAFEAAWPRLSESSTAPPSLVVRGCVGVCARV